MAAIGFGQAERYTTYAFRRGCLMEMKQPQSTAAEIMRTAGWTSGQFKTYLDLQADEEDVTLSQMRRLDTGGDPNCEDNQPDRDSDRAA